MEEGAEGNWQQVEDITLPWSRGFPLSRQPTTSARSSKKWGCSRRKSSTVWKQNYVVNGINDAYIERHIQNSKAEFLDELEPSSRKERGRELEREHALKREPLKAFPLAVVLKACPQISDYASGGSIGTWRDLMSAGVVVRLTLGISPSAYQDACEAKGAENAAGCDCLHSRAGGLHQQQPGGF